METKEIEVETKHKQGAAMDPTPGKSMCMPF
jgi:hypothetical protein